MNFNFSGAIGEVGLVAEMVQDKIDVEVVGTLQQRIESCLGVLDALLASPQPIVSSVVVADKYNSDATQDTKLSLVKSVMKIMGIRDIKTVSTKATLAELGMDSLMSVEIKQMLEREFDCFLTAQQLRSTSLGKFQEMSNTQIETVKKEKKYEAHLNVLFRNLGDESTSDETIFPINKGKDEFTETVFIPGVEGVGGSVWHELGANLKSSAHLLQLMKTRNEQTLQGVADMVIDDVIQCFAKHIRFHVVGYSFGSLIAIKIASMLEMYGYHGNVILIDGSPAYLKRLAQGMAKTTTLDDENKLFMVLFKHLCSAESTDRFVTTLDGLTDTPSKINLVIEHLSDEIKLTYSREYLYNMTVAILNRLKVVIGMNISDDDISAVIDAKLRSKITLVRPTQSSFKDIDEDYGLHHYSEYPIEVRYVKGNHLSMLDNSELITIINNITSAADIS